MGNDMMNSIWRRIRREDDGLMSQSMMMVMILPAIMGALIAALLMNMQVDNAKQQIVASKTSAENLSNLILSDLNDGYPISYLTMSKSDLKAATTYRDRTNGSYAYVTNFNQTDPAFTAVKISAFPTSTAKKGREFTYHFRASDSPGYIGKIGGNERPHWLPFTSGISTLALYEKLPAGTDKSEYPPAPWEVGQRPNEPQNPRIIRSIQYGVILVWDKPDNAGPAALNGYELVSENAPQVVGCEWMKDSDGEYVGVDGFLVLNSDIDAAPRTWKCNPTAGSKISIRGTSPNGLGLKIISILDDLQVTSDLIPASPVSPATNLKVISSTGINSKTSWTGVTCPTSPDSSATPEYQYIWVTGNSGSSPWQAGDTYTSSHNKGTTLTWIISARCAGKYNDSSTVESAPMTFISPTDPATNLRIITAGSTSTQVAWNGVSCATGTTANYRLVLTTLSGAAIRTTAWETSLTTTITHAPGNGIRWVVESRCGEGGVYSITIPSIQAYFVAIPTAPTGLAVVGTPGANQTTVKWNTVTSCAPGSQVEYKFEWVPAVGNYSYQLSTQILATNPSTSGTATWKVSSRCTYSTYSSQNATSVNSSFPLTIANPTAPVSLSVSGQVARWSTVTCPASGSTPLYKFIWGSGGINGPTIFNTVTSYTATAQNQGTSINWRVQVKCIAGGRESGIVTSAFGPVIITAVTRPTGTLTASGNGVSTIYPGTNTISCGKGARAQYMATRLRHGNDWTRHNSSWTWSSTFGMPGNNWEGFYIEFNMSVKCVGNGVSSAAATTGSASWRRGISVPAAPYGLYFYHGSYYNSLGWAGVGCNPGNTPLYTVHFWSSNGRFNYWSETYGLTYNRPGVPAMNATFYYQVAAVCKTQDPTAGDYRSGASWSYIVAW